MRNAPFFNMFKLGILISNHIVLKKYIHEDCECRDDII